MSQISRSISRYLKLNEDLSEAISLAHDLGHPPFGHAGETILDYCIRDHGGFNHNIHSIRLVTELEKESTANFLKYVLDIQSALIHIPSIKLNDERIWIENELHVV